MFQVLAPEFSPTGLFSAHRSFFSARRLTTRKRWKFFVFSKH